MSDIAVQSSQPAAESAGATAQADPISSFNLSSLHEKALSHMGGDETPSEVGEAMPSLPSAEQPQVSAEVTEVAAQTPAQLAQLSDDALVEVVVDGETIQMPWKEARSGISRQSKFTREMQALRQKETEFETRAGQLTEYAQQREQLVALLNNEELFKQFAAQRYPDLFAGQQPAGQLAPQQGFDPEEIATVGQLQQAIQQHLAQVEQKLQSARGELQKDIETATVTIEDRQAVAKYSAEINTLVTDIFKENPLISRLIPNAEQVLRYEVSKLQPRTPEEAKTAFKMVAAGWAEEIKAAVTESTKQQVINKQSLVENNVQAPGGSPLGPQATNFKDSKTGKLDWNKLHEAAVAYVK